MKTLARFPADLVTLLFSPIILLAVIAIMASCALPLFNWLHQRSTPAPRRADVASDR